MHLTWKQQRELLEAWALDMKESGSQFPQLGQAITAALTRLDACSGDDPNIWDDKPDEWTPEIEKAFPTRSESHEEYATAMRMVGNRRSKGALVALVNWLLVRLERKERGA
jgi:hypothetical protein